MAPKADAKKGKKEESESGSYESEEYEYETESEESSEKKPAAKKDDAKKPEAKKDDAKPAAKPAAAAAKKESSDDDDESEEYEYETETESSEKKPAAKATATVTADAKKADGKAAAVTATAKVTTTAAAAKKKDESEDDEESEEYEYESEYESESDDKKKAPAAKPADTKAAAAAASKPADTKPAAAAATGKAADNKAAAASMAKPTATAATTTTTTTTTTVVAAREVVAVKPHGVVEDPAHPWQPRKFVAEFLGTMIFCLVVYMSRMNQAPYSVYYGWPLGGMVSQALVQAFALMAVTAAFGGVSGGHFNPAVTLFMILTRQTHVAIGLIYCIVQFSGAILGGALAWGLTSPLVVHHMPNGAGTGYAAPITCTVFPISHQQANGTAPGNGYMNTAGGSVAGAGLSEWSCWPQAFGAEIMGSAIFIFLYGMVWVSGHGYGMNYVSLGMALGMLVFAYEDISNAFFNPARALGSAAFAGNFYQWDNFWVFIIGPIIGAIIATIFWGLLYQRSWDRSIGSSLIDHRDQNM